MQSEPLEHVLDHALRLRRRFAFRRGLLFLLLFLLVVVPLACWLDIFLQVDHGLLRYLLSCLVAIGVTGLLVAKVLLPQVFKPSGFDLACELENHFPQLHDRLTTAVEFERKWSREAEFGHNRSQLEKSLARVTIQQVESALSQVSVSSAYQYRRLTSLAAFVVAMTIANIVLTAGHVEQVSLATSRLLFPWEDLQWPRECELLLVDIDGEPLSFDHGRRIKLSRNDEISLFVVNKLGLLPSDVSIERRLGDSTEVEPLPGTSLSRSRLRFVGSDGSFSFRVVGGDDDTMPWTSVDVQEPPLVTSAVLRQTPPDYSELEASKLPHGTISCDIVQGSLLEIGLTMSRPLAELRCRLESGRHEVETGIETKVTGASEVDGEWGVLSLKSVGESSTSVSLGARLEIPDIYQLSVSLVDHQGYANPSAWNLRINLLPDRPPKVTFVSEQRESLVLPTARIDFEIEAEDDLSLKQVGLDSFTSDDSQPKTLWREFVSEVDQVSLRRTIPITLDYKNLGEGQSILVQARAFDGRSTSASSAANLVEFKIVTLEELLGKWSADLDLEIQQLKESAEQLESVVAEWDHLLESASIREEAGSIPSARMQALVFEQQNIRQNFDSGPRSLRARLGQLQFEVERNQVANDLRVEPMLEFCRTVERIAETEISIWRRNEAELLALPPFEHGTTTASRTSLTQAVRSNRDAASDLLLAWKALILQHERSTSYPEILQTLRQMVDRVQRVREELESEQTDDARRGRLSVELRQLSRIVNQLQTRLDGSHQQQQGDARTLELRQRLNELYLSARLRNAADQLSRGTKATVVRQLRLIEDEMKGLLRRPGAATTSANDLGNEEPSLLGMLRASRKQQEELEQEYATTGRRTRTWIRNVLELKAAGEGIRDEIEAIRSVYPHGSLPQWAADEVLSLWNENLREFGQKVVKRETIRRTQICEAWLLSLRNRGGETIDAITDEAEPIAHVDELSLMVELQTELNARTRTLSELQLRSDVGPLEIERLASQQRALIDWYTRSRDNDSPMPR